MLENSKLSHMLGKDSIIKSHPHSYDTVLNKTNDVHLPRVHKPDNCILCCCVKTLPSKLCHGVGALLILYKQQKGEKLIILLIIK